MKTYNIDISVVFLALLVPVFLIVTIWGIRVSLRGGRKIQRLMDAATRYYQDGSSRDKF